MRRLLFTALTSAALLVGGSATALAQSHAGHHHHSSHSHRSAVRTERWGTTTVRSTDQSSSSPAPANAAAPASTPHPAGTVASFSGGVLIVRLNDGSMVSGLVTDATELACQAAATNATPHGEGGDDQGEESPGNDGHDGGDGADEGQGGPGGGHDGGGDEQATAPLCSTGALTPGAVVGEAELRISSAGAVWVKLELAS
jgi:hypothetical protein